MTRPNFPRTLILTAIASLWSQAHAADADAAAQQQQLEQRIDQLSKQLDELKAQMGQLKTQPPSAAPAAPAPAVAAAPPAAARPSASPFDNLSLWGYGELYYTRPWHQSDHAQSDLARAVFGIGYQFDDKTLFNSEYEVEHGVASASDVGEFEVEQFYVARQLGEHATADVGLFLMPFGLLNEHHEPTNFYGMQRNFVETLVIPSTWREGGLNLKGQTDGGVGFSAGVTTGFDLSKWNFAPEFPLYTNALELEDNDIAPLQATHQELALANASHLSSYVAASYTGLPGLTLGGAFFTGNAVPVPAPPNAVIPGNERVTLWEAHARWTPTNFDLSALYAHGSIGNTALANVANPGSPNPIPAAFYGYYAQAAYTGFQPGGFQLSPFARWERYNLGARFDGTTGPVVPTGIVPLSATPGDYGLWAQNNDRVLTLGANFYLNPHVVFKLDYQKFNVNTQFNRVDLGVGLNF